MLFLVPCNKTDEDESGKAASPTRGRVLVVLPPDTDLSSNVVVPDTAITNTLITNNTLDGTHDFSSPSQLTLNKLSSAESMQLTRDHLGIIQPTVLDNIYQHYRLQYQQSPKPTLSNVQGFQDEFHPRRSVQYPSPEDTISRARRHSHSGLVEMDHGIVQALNRSRSRSRSTYSQAVPYQHQASRTSRALRAALKKNRKDQSPLLTSASFGTDYSQFRPDLRSSGDPFGERRVHQQHYNAVQPTLGLNQSPEIVHWPSNPGLSSESELSSESLNTKLDVFTGGGQSTHPRHSTMASCLSDDSEIDIDGDTELGRGTRVDTSTSGSVRNTYLRKKKLVDSQEDIDVVGVSDEEMEASRAPMVLQQTSHVQKEAVERMEMVPTAATKSSNSSNDKLPQSTDDMGTYDADMGLILGMASDMELVMPKFDDEYLNDLKKDLSLPVQREKRTPSTSAVSPASSHSSSTTITCISSLPFPPSRSMTPGLFTAGHAQTQESPPTSPATIEARKRSGTLAVEGPLPLEHMSAAMRPGAENSPTGQDLSTIHKDIDNLKRHRDSLRDSTEMGSVCPMKGAMTPSHLPSANIPSRPASTCDKKSNPQTHLYFKPSHHFVPERTGPGPAEFPHQNAMIIQSNQWTIDNAQFQRPGFGDRMLSIQQPPMHATRGNEGNHIFSVRESSPTPSLPPAPSLDKDTIMTTNNISLATANMSVLTPREVQEDYYAKRNIQRMYQMRNRRRGSTSSACATVAAPIIPATNLSIPPPLRRASSVFPMSSHPSDSSIPLPLRGKSISPNMPSQLMEGFGSGNNGTAAAGNSRLGVSTMVGASNQPLPASYYIPPSAFRTEAAVAAERAAECQRREDEELKDSFLVFPSPMLS
ncbi:hypothetical protein BG004_003507 [Podila humilis]|nr:hypothetical protein BG004_003507 [Podila humilis]